MEINDFSGKICNWYQNNKRDLPWRSTDNPYYIWLSEIILQQTRVEQGLEYYFKFIHRFLKLILLEKPMKKNQRLSPRRCTPLPP